MKIVGQVSSPQEANEIEFIVKVLVVRNRTITLAEQAKQMSN